MFRRFAGGLLLCALGALAASCNSTTTTPTSLNTTTDTFTGTLTPNKSDQHAFVTTAGGAVSSTLVTIGPDNTISVGFSMGTYNATTNVCTIVLDNPAAVQGSTLSGTASTSGIFCLRVYDNGTVQTAINNGVVSDSNPFTYTVTVTHP
jgi:hypothetical protein